MPDVQPHPYDSDYANWRQTPLPELTRAQLEAISHQHGLDARKFSRIESHGVINSVYAVDDRFVVRVPRNIAEGIRATYAEAATVPVVHAAGIRCPQLAVFDDSRRVVDVPFTIYEFVHGCPMSERDDGAVESVWRDLGRELARLHDRVTSAPGELIATAVPLFVRVGRGDRIEPSEVPGVIAEVRDKGHITPSNAEWFHRTLDRLEPAVASASSFRRFLHRDAGARNVIVRDGALVALLDWGNAGWGDPALDFRHIPLSRMDDALAGYREVMPVDGDEDVECRILWDRITVAIFALWNEPDAQNPDSAPAGPVIQLMAAATGDGRWSRWLR